MDNAIYGSAKAWVNFAGASGTVNGSYNISSVTRSSTGIYVINMTTSMSNTSYATVALCSDGKLTRGESISSTSQFGVSCSTSNGSAYVDPTSVYCAVFR